MLLKRYKKLTMLLILLIVMLPGSIGSFEVGSGDEGSTDPCVLPDGCFPNPDDCSSFFKCQSGEPEIEQCSDGLLYNPFKLTCDFNETGSCSSSDDFTSTSASAPTNDLECPTDGPNIYPIQSSCSEYYLCDNGNAYRVECPTGLLMNRDKMTCDYSQNVECDITSGTEESTVGITAIFETKDEEPDTETDETEVSGEPSDFSLGTEVNSELPPTETEVPSKENTVSQTETELNSKVTDHSPDISEDGSTTSDSSVPEDTVIDVTTTVKLEETSTAVSVTEYTANKQPTVVTKSTAQTEEGPNDLYTEATSEQTIIGRIISESTSDATASDDITTVNDQITSSDTTNPYPDTSPEDVSLETNSSGESEDETASEVAVSTTEFSLLSSTISNGSSDSMQTDFDTSTAETLTKSTDIDSQPEETTENENLTTSYQTSIVSDKENSTALTIIESSSSESDFTETSVTNADIDENETALTSETETASFATSEIALLTSVSTESTTVPASKISTVQESISTDGETSSDIPETDLSSGSYLSTEIVKESKSTDDEDLTETSSSHSIENDVGSTLPTINSSEEQFTAASQEEAITESITHSTVTDNFTEDVSDSGTNVDQIVTSTAEATAPDSSATEVSPNVDANSSEIITVENTEGTFEANESTTFTTDASTLSTVSDDNAITEEILITEIETNSQITPGKPMTTTQSLVSPDTSTDNEISELTTPAYESTMITEESKESLIESTTANATSSFISDNSSSSEIDELIITTKDNAPFENQTEEIKSTSFDEFTKDSSTGESEPDVLTKMSSIEPDNLTTDNSQESFTTTSIGDDEILTSANSLISEDMVSDYATDETSGMISSQEISTPLSSNSSSSIEVQSTIEPETSFEIVTTEKESDMEDISSTKVFPSSPVQTDAVSDTIKTEQEMNVTVKPYTEMESTTKGDILIPFTTSEISTDSATQISTENELLTTQAPEEENTPLPITEFTSGIITEDIVSATETSSKIDLPTSELITIEPPVSASEPIEENKATSLTTSSDNLVTENASLDTNALSSESISDELITTESNDETILLETSTVDTSAESTVVNNDGTTVLSYETPPSTHSQTAIDTTEELTIATDLETSDIIKSTLSTKTEVSEFSVTDAMPTTTEQATEVSINLTDISLPTNSVTDSLNASSGPTDFETSENIFSSTVSDDTSKETELPDTAQTSTSTDASTNLPTTNLETFESTTESFMSTDLLTTTDIKEPVSLNTETDFDHVTDLMLSTTIKDSEDDSQTTRIQIVTSTGLSEDTSDQTTIVSTISSTNYDPSTESTLKTDFPSTLSTDTDANSSLNIMVSSTTIVDNFETNSESSKSTEIDTDSETTLKLTSETLATPSDITLTEFDEDKSTSISTVGESKVSETLESTDGTSSIQPTFDDASENTFEPSSTHVETVPSTEKLLSTEDPNDENISKTIDYLSTTELDDTSRIYSTESTPTAIWTSDLSEETEAFISEDFMSTLSPTASSSTLKSTPESIATTSESSEDFETTSSDIFTSVSTTDTESTNSLMPDLTSDSTAVKSTDEDTIQTSASLTPEITNVTTIDYGTSDTTSSDATNLILTSQSTELMTTLEHLTISNITDEIMTNSVSTVSTTRLSSVETSKPDSLGTTEPDASEETSTNSINFNETTETIINLITEVKDTNTTEGNLLDTTPYSSTFEGTTINTETYETPIPTSNSTDFDYISKNTLETDLPSKFSTEIGTLSSETTLDSADSTVSYSGITDFTSKSTETEEIVETSDPVSFPYTILETSSESEISTNSVITSAYPSTKDISSEDTFSNQTDSDLDKTTVPETSASSDILYTDGFTTTSELHTEIDKDSSIPSETDISVTDFTSTNSDSEYSITDMEKSSTASESTESGSSVDDLSESTTSKPFKETTEVEDATSYDKTTNFTPTDIERTSYPESSTAATFYTTLELETFSEEQSSTILFGSSTTKEIVTEGRTPNVDTSSSERTTVSETSTTSDIFPTDGTMFTTELSTESSEISSPFTTYSTSSSHLPTEAISTQGSTSDGTSLTYETVSETSTPLDNFSTNDDKFSSELPIETSEDYSTFSEGIGTSDTDFSSTSSTSEYNITDMEKTTSPTIDETTETDSSVDDITESTTAKPFSTKDDSTDVASSSTIITESTEDLNDTSSTTEFTAGLRTEEETDESASEQDTVTELNTIPTILPSGNATESIVICIKPNGFNPDPNDCNKFYECSKGVPKSSSCAENNHFNPVEEICEDPCQAKCDPNADCPTTKTTITSEGSTLQTALTDDISSSTPNSDVTEPEERSTSVSDSTSRVISTDSDATSSLYISTSGSTFESEATDSTFDITTKSMSNETTFAVTTDHSSILTDVETSEYPSTSIMDRSTTEGTSENVTYNYQSSVSAEDIATNPSITNRSTSEFTTDFASILTESGTSEGYSSTNSMDNFTDEGTSESITRDYIITMSVEDITTRNFTLNPSTYELTTDLSSVSTEAGTSEYPSTIIIDRSTTEHSESITYDHNSSTPNEDATTDSTTHLYSSERTDIITSTDKITSSSNIQTEPSSYRTEETDSESEAQTSETEITIGSTPYTSTKLVSFDENTQTVFSSSVPTSVTPTECHGEDCLPSQSPTDSTDAPHIECRRNDFLSGSSCNEYTDCTGKFPHKRECPMGLHFNPTTRVCDWPYKAECGEIPKPLFTPDGTFHCPRKSCLIPSTASCSQYYLCLGYTPYLLECSTNLYFDPTMNTCNYAPMVNCLASTTSATTITKPTRRTSTSTTASTIKLTTSIRTTPTTTSRPERFVCPSKEGLFRYPTNCGMFYQCSNWYPYAMHCPANTHFSEITKRCEYPCDAQCDLTLRCGKSSSAPSDPRCSCKNCKLPSPDTCTKYIVCTDGRARIQNCPRGQTFDENRQTCDWANKVTCSHNEMCPKRNGMFSHKDDCHKFVHCSNGIPSVKSCPYILEFDPIKERCEWPSGKCGQSPIAKEFDVFKQEEQRSGWRCPKSFGYFMDDKECHKFYHCKFGTPSLKECTDGLMYNHRHQTCDWRGHVNCNYNRHITPKRCRKYDNRIKCPRDRSPLPHPLHCSRYYDCTAGRACAKQCPNGLYYNKTSKICDFPKNVKCPLPHKEDYTLKEFSIKCESGAHDRISNPADEACFYHCRQGKVITGCCNSGHIYNLHKDKCERKTKSFKL